MLLRERKKESKKKDKNQTTELVQMREKGLLTVGGGGFPRV